MNNSLKEKLNIYCKEISDKALCPKKQKIRLIKELRSQIEEFLENTPGADIDEIREVFGTPEEIAESFAGGISYSDIKKKLSFKKIVLVFLLTAVLIWAVFAVISFIDVHTEAHGYFSEEILNIYNVSGGEII